MPQVLAFCKFDIFANDTFYVGSRVYRQKRGLAIGGTGSAQLASICLFMSQNKGYPAWIPPANDPQGHHPCDLLVHPFRFRDNLIGLKYSSTSLSTIQQVFEHIHNIPLQIENEGLTLTSLESDIYLSKDEEATNFVGARMANKFATPATSGNFKYRYPEPQVPNARRTVTTSSH